MTWQPWHSSTAQNSDRTISVTGESILQSEPDQFNFNPNYEFKDANRDAALASLSSKNTELVAKLKALGVADSGIKTNASDYGRGGVYYSGDSMSKDANVSYTLQLTITIQNKDLAQKVQDYLTTTSPSGSITPYNSFSDSKRKQLESQARDAATKDARAKAEQSARNLGFTLGNVKSVSDGSGFGIAEPAVGKAMSATDSVSSVPPVAPSITVQPGQDPLSYSVTVEYYLK